MASLDCGGRSLIEDIQGVLLGLERNPYPEVPNPEGCPKRAAVACIVRVRPGSRIPHEARHTFADRESVQSRIVAFFKQAWVQHGEPEILFIRRAARRGDRWTSQVALPGGKRDPADASDRATSIRETMEEIGLNLASRSVLSVGKLPERIITTEWGTVPLMVLCPYVYLVTEPSLPSLHLQADEVASTHWVPVRALLASSLCTYESANTSDRYARQGGTLLRLVLRMLLGNMLFGAIRLMPSESFYSTNGPSSLPSQSGSLFRNRFQELSSMLLGKVTIPGRPEQPLLLWGLTHGIVIDLLRLLPSSDVLASWRWPTFSAPDVRFMVWLISWSFRRDKLRSVTGPESGPRMVLEESFASKDSALKLYTRKPQPQVKIGRGSVPQHSAVHYMLHGYFDLVQRGILLSVVLRISVGLTVVVYIAKRYLNR